MCAFQIRKRKKEKKVRDRERRLRDSSSVGEAKKARESEGR